MGLFQKFDDCDFDEYGDYVPCKDTNTKTDTHDDYYESVSPLAIRD